MRPFLRWLVNGKPPPRPEPILMIGEMQDPRTDALKAMAASLEVQTAMMGTHALLLERNAVATESVLAALDRAEKRALEAAEQREITVRT